MRDETIAVLEEIIELLHKTTKNVAISNAVGSSVSAVGGIIFIGGLIAAPFTLGASLVPMAIAGGVTAGLGDATVIGSSIAGVTIDSKQFDKAKTCIENDRSHLEILRKEIECHRKMYQFAIDLIEKTVHPASGSCMASNPDPAGPRLGYIAARAVAPGIATSSTVAASRVVATGTITGARAFVMALARMTAVAGLGLDIAMIAFNAVKLGK